MREEILKRLKLSDNVMAHGPLVRTVDAVLKLVDELTVSIINDGAMTQCMEDDLQQNYEYTIAEAHEWIEEHGEEDVGAMWDEYSHYFEDNAMYKG